MDAAQAAELDAIVSRSRQVPVERPRRRRPGAVAIVALAVLVLAIAAGGAAAVVVLPAADITITPRIEPVGPMSLTVTADPAATAADPATRVIPAQTVQIPVEVSRDFPATGKRVEETKATGGVRWSNCDPTASYSIPKGTVVRTSGGTGFATAEQAFLPVAPLSGTPPNVTVQCTSSEVAVTAVEPGEGGNVAAGAIKIVPARYNRTVLSVSNRAATSGGTHTEFPRVDKKDVDAAITALKADVAAQFATELENADHAPPGATVFTATGVPGEPVPSVDPTTLVGQEGATFTLGMTATGTVLAVDPSPVRAIAEARLAASIQAGYQLIAGSTDVEVGEGTVTEGLIDFPVTVTARQLRPVDGAALERQILGLSKADATRILQPYGDVVIALWPGWVSSIPSMDQRVTLAVTEPVDHGPTPTPTPSATPTPRPTPAPTPSATPASSGDAGGGASPSEPVPSG
jgi:hypothetical protein